MSDLGGRAWRGLAASLGAAGMGLVVMVVVVGAFGYDPLVVARAFGSATLGGAGPIADLLLVACPLIVIGLGLTLAFRCGVWNIGAEGQYLLGSAAAAWAALMVGRWPSVVALPVVIGFAIGAGAVWAGVAGWLRQRRGVQEVLSTILLNFVAAQLLSILVRGPLVDPASSDRDSTALISSAASLPMLSRSLQLHAGIVVAVLLAPAMWFFLARTTWGFRTRVVGANPIAARFAWIPAGRYSAWTFAASGAFAGLAGAIELCGNTHYLTAGYSSNYGYTAIAVALLARLQPWGVVPAALFFAALETGVRGLQKSPDPGLRDFPTVLTMVAQGVVILATVMLTRVRLGGRSAT